MLGNLRPREMRRHSQDLIFPLLAISTACLSGVANASPCHDHIQAEYYASAKKAAVNVLIYCEWHAKQGSSYSGCLKHFGIKQGTTAAMVKNNKVCITNVIPFQAAERVCNQGDPRSNCINYWYAP